MKLRQKYIIKGKYIICPVASSFENQAKLLYIINDRHELFTNS